MTDLLILGNTAIAMLLGAIVGYERELADKPAGLRTHMLVAATAALLVGLGETILTFFVVNGSGSIQSDPIRIVEAVITGVSFLGAGTIMRRRKAEEVEGLTTAASLLFVAVIGICVGLSKWPLAVGAMVLAMLTLKGMKIWERRMTDE